MKKGFTLIELLVVIAIIAIIALLLSIVFASVSAAREKAVVTKAISESLEIEKAIELSRLSVGRLPVNMNPANNIKQTPSVESEILAYISKIPESPTFSGVEVVVDRTYISDGKIAYVNDIGLRDGGSAYSGFLRCGAPSEGDYYPDDHVNYFIADGDEKLGSSFEKVYISIDFCASNPDRNFPGCPDVLLGYSGETYEDYGGYDNYMANDNWFEYFSGDFCALNDEECLNRRYHAYCAKT
jgi:prepilin-type N-terminal cleavage/methylation domain-containing protein